MWIILEDNEWFYVALSEWVTFLRLLISIIIYIVL